MQITVITITKVCHHEMVFIHFETFMRWVAHDTGPSNLAHQDGNIVVTTIHRCFPLSPHNIYSEVAIVTICTYFCDCLVLAISGIESL